MDNKDNIAELAWKIIIHLPFIPNKFENIFKLDQIKNNTVDWEHYIDIKKNKYDILYFLIMINFFI